MSKIGKIGQQEKYLPPGTLMLDPYRFRDNIVGVIRGKIGLTRVQKWFEFLYSLDLQQEGEGLVLPSLVFQYCILFIFLSSSFHISYPFLFCTINSLHIPWKRRMFDGKIR